MTDEEQEEYSEEIRPLHLVDITPPELHVFIAYEEGEYVAYQHDPGVQYCAQDEIARSTDQGEIIHLVKAYTVAKGERALVTFGRIRIGPSIFDRNGK